MINKGYDSSFYDHRKGYYEVSVFNPNNIRSIHAAFDPDFKESPNLLASHTYRKGLAAWTAARIKGLLNAYAYQNEPLKTKALAVYVSPDEFLKATTTPDSLKELEQEVTELNQEKLLNERQPTFLQGDLSGFQTEFSIKNHEGRHRMIALRNAGITHVPIVIEIQSAMTLDFIDSLIMRGYRKDSFVNE